MKRNRIKRCHANKYGVSIHFGSNRRIVYRWTPEEFSKEQTYEIDPYSSKQNKHYSLVVHGLKSISLEEAKSLPKTEIEKIVNNFKQAKIEINKLKNEVLDNMFKSQIPKVFNEEHSKIAKALTESCEEYYDEPNFLTFSSLGITKQMIINRLVIVGILDSTIFNI